MSDSIDPGPKRAPAVESSKAPPERDVNLLEEVTTLIGITLVRSCEPFERWTEGCGGVGIPLFERGRPAGISHSIEVVAREEVF